MTIEEELKTTNFENAQHKTVLNIFFSASWLRTRTKTVLKKFGLSPEQFNVLRILRGQASRALCLKEITSRMIDRSSNTTRIVEKLAGKLLIQRTQSHEDKRELEIIITTEGLQILAQIDTLFAHEEAYTALNLQTEECAILNNLLDKMRGL